MSKIACLENCPSSLVHLALQDFNEILGGKWRFSIIILLYFSPQRFVDIRKHLLPITPRALSTNLKDLEMNLIVIKDKGSGAFRLTEYAYSLKEVIHAIQKSETDMCSKHLEQSDIQILLVTSAQQIFQLLGGKWRMPIIASVLYHEMLFNELKKSISGISSKELSKNLQLLNKALIIEKRINDVNGRSSYSISTLARQYESLFETILGWSLEHRKQITSIL